MPTRQAELFYGGVPGALSTKHVFRAALRAMAAYRLSWFDAHRWAYAERYAIPEIVSEDSEHERL
jgi:predicted nucleic acid-binding protein